MGKTFVVRDQEGQYFVTFTVHQWVDVFTRPEYANILLDSIRYCQKNKGLRVYSWVIMSNHVHMIISSDKGNLSDIIRDMNKYTASKIVRAIEANTNESRKSWLLWLLKKDDNITFWKEGYHGKEIISSSFFETKLNYIHQNPVKAKIVEKEEEYLYSSCSHYYGNRKGLLELVAP